ncbi:MAG: DEAD/DEAH box helicase family protein, partial [bacterium]
MQGEHRAGLIWHTQGSGKSLTMVYAALKLKFHRGIRSPRLENHNLLILTDRVDLHDQISATFRACGLPNPEEARSIDDLRQRLTQGGAGLTVLSTIFKFHWADPGLTAGPARRRADALRGLAVP